MTSCVALVVAAGRGLRFGGASPKQYLPLAGRSLLRHALDALLTHPGVEGACVVRHPEDAALYAAATRGLDLLPPVPGGATRQDSVRHGLESLIGLAPERVLIHDAARPFPGSDLIDRVLAGLDAAPAAIPALPVRDTLKRGRQGCVVETLAREGLWLAQTPQGFRFAEILAAHRACAGAALPDDAAVAERAGLEVRLVEGSAENFKVTTPEDLRDAERLIAVGQGDIRIGQGVDVHGFGPGDHLWLCGVSIPHEQGLVGHSDADAGLHALTDAILGALGAGDIGVHFPPGDPQWQGAPSAVFLRRAADMVAAAAGSVAHVDVTIICERPRIGPHRAAMVRRIAEILAIDAGRVSVKATTTEGLGFTGRGEGIAAEAVATLRLPLR